MARATPSTEFTRRALLAGIAGSAALAACGGSTRAADPIVETTVDTSRLFLSAYFDSGGNGAIRSGIPQRTIWGLRDADGLPMRELPPTLDFVIERNGFTIGDPITAMAHTDGVAIPYYPLFTVFDDPGLYTVSATHEGRSVQADLVIDAPEDVALVQPGEMAIPVLTPTVDDARGVDPICTAFPNCGFHEMTFADAMQSGGPSVLLVSTPAFCQTQVCGPVLQLLIEEAPKRPDFAVVHAEVYADVAQTGDPLASQIAEVVTAYRLPFEPSLLVVNANGTVAERLDFTYDRTELIAALDKAT